MDHVGRCAATKGVGGHLRPTGKWLRSAVILAIALSWPLSLWGQSLTRDVQQEVLTTDDRRTQALRDGNAAPLREIYAQDYTLVTPAGVIRGKADQISEIESGRLRYPRIEVIERTVRVYGDVAVVLSRDKYNILLDGQQKGGDLRFTRVYKKFGTGWQLIATHGSPIGE